MKKTKKIVTNRLFNYIEDATNARDSAVNNLDIAFSSDKSACYISLGTIDFQDVVWLFEEQHLTVERDVNNKHPFLSPSHFTLCFRSKKLPHHRCKIHVYFDIVGNFNGTILKSVWEIRDNNLPVQIQETPMILSEGEILQYAVHGQHILFNIMSSKSSKYLKIVRELGDIDRTLYGQLEDLKALKNNKKKMASVLQAIQQYKDHLDQMDRYRDDYQDDWRYLERLSDVLHHVEHAFYKAVPKESAAELTRTFSQKISVKENASPIFQVKSESSKPFDAKAQERMIAEQHIQKLYADLLSVGGVDHATIEKMTEYFNVLQALHQALLLYELLYDTHEDIVFAQGMRERLPRQWDMVTQFSHYVLEGNREKVSYIYENTEIKFDFVDLFEKLFQKIEESSATALKLTPVAQYFYEKSELYRAYAMYRIGNLVFGYQEKKHVRCDYLVKMYIDENIAAFTLYAQHGMPPSRHHLMIGEVALNALQAIISFTKDGAVLKEYMDVLFQYGAGIETRAIRMPKFYTLYNGEKAATLPEAFLYMQSDKKNTSKLNVVYKNADIGITAQEKNQRDRILLCKNILKYSYHLSFKNSEIYYRAIAKKCSVALLLNEFVDKAKLEIFHINVLASRKGGCLFFPNEKELERHAADALPLSEHEEDVYAFSLNLNSEVNQVINDSNFLNNKNWLTHIKALPLLSTDKTVCVYITPNPHWKNDKDVFEGYEGMEHYLKTTEILFNIFKEKYALLQKEEQLKIIEDCRRQAVSCSIRKDNENASMYFLASMLGLSLINPKTGDDYKLLFSVILQYAKTVEKLCGTSVGSISPAMAILMNTHKLYEALSPIVQKECPSSYITAVEKCLQESREVSSGQCSLS